MMIIMPGALLLMITAAFGFLVNIDINHPNKKKE
jgi:hypothetical protein